MGGNHPRIINWYSLIIPDSISLSLLLFDPFVLLFFSGVDWVEDVFNIADWVSLADLDRSPPFELLLCFWEGEDLDLDTFPLCLSLDELREEAVVVVAAGVVEAVEAKEEEETAIERVVGGE